MSNKMITVQKPVPAFRSLSTTISNLTWNWGLGNFFIQNIPNSFSTSYGYATKLVEAFILQLNATNKFNKHTPLYSLEIGAGTGVLSKHFLDKLYELYPNVYNRITHYVTDLSQKNLDGILSSKILKTHSSKVTTCILDATKPISLPTQLDLVIMVNLLDSLPTRHFYKENNVIYEVLIESNIPDNAFVIDSTKPTPNILNAMDIKALLGKEYHTKKDQNIILNLSSQLTSIIKETHCLEPINEHNYEQEEYKFYITFLNHLKIKNTDYLNLSYSHHLLLKELHSICNNSSLIMIRDAGNTNGYSLNKENLTLSFNSARFHPINLPSIFEIGKFHKFEGMASSNTSSFSEVFATLFKKTNQISTKIVQLLKHDEEVDLEIKWSKEIELHNKDKFVTFFNKNKTIIPYTNSYFLTQFLTIHAIQLGYHELALTVLNSSNIIYPCYLKVALFKSILLLQFG